MRIDPKLKLLTMVVFVFLAALLYCEHLVPKDGVLFQTINNAFVGFAAILGNDLRKELGQGVDASPPGMTNRTTDVHTEQGQGGVT